MKQPKFIRRLSTKELRTLAGLCATAALLVLAAVALATRPLWQQPHAKMLPGDDKKPWALELP